MGEETHHKILFRLRAFLELRWGLGEGRAPQSYSPCVVLREEMAKRFGSWFPSEKKKKKNSWEATELQLIHNSSNLRRRQLSGALGILCPQRDTLALATPPGSRTQALISWPRWAGRSGSEMTHPAPQGHLLLAQSAGSSPSKLHPSVLTEAAWCPRTSHTLEADRPEFTTCLYRLSVVLPDSSIPQFPYL